jgi:hypothetical protein
VAQETNFDMGRFEEAIETLKQGQQEIRREQSEIKDDLSTIKIAFAEAKGGWAVVLFLGSGLAMFVGFIFSHFPFFADFFGRTK